MSLYELDHLLPAQRKKVIRRFEDTWGKSMALREITDSGQVFEIKDFKERPDFKRQWRQNLTEAQRAAVLSEINRRIDGALASPSPNWGSIMNTSIEGGKTNPLTGERGDWSGTPFEPLYNA